MWALGDYINVFPMHSHAHHGMHGCRRWAWESVKNLGHRLLSCTIGTHVQASATGLDLHTSTQSMYLDIRREFT